MTANVPRIQFGQLMGFPQISTAGRINTKQFLDAAREIVTLIEAFGKVFSPVVYDINGNIEKLSKVYSKDEKELVYLDRLLQEDTTHCHHSKEAMLWLYRALKLLEQFFTNVLNDAECKENLKCHMKSAYSVTLKQYHSWIIQEAFSVIYRLLPYRSQLLGSGTANDDNMKCLASLLLPMRSNLEHIYQLLTKAE